jgi:hypothetical protein
VWRKTLRSLVLVLLLAAPASAQITIPFTFTNGTVADATQVNADMSALGTAALNRTGGTMTGTLTSRAVVPSASNLYDLGTTGARFKDGWFAGTITAPTFSGAGTSLTGVALLGSGNTFSVLNAFSAGLTATTGGFTGAVTMSSGLTVSAGALAVTAGTTTLGNGVIVSAGGASVAGNTVVTSGAVIVGGLGSNVSVVPGDLMTNRGDTKGNVWFGNTAGLHFIHYDGTKFLVSDAVTFPGGVPTTDNTYSLGSSTLAFATVFTRVISPTNTGTATIDLAPTDAAGGPIGGLIIGAHQGAGHNSALQAQARGTGGWTSYFQMAPDTNKPTCDATTRGALFHTAGGAGVKDAVEVCAKDAANAYAYRVIY